MFKIAEKSELCQISLTGVRAIVLVGLLMNSPLSLEEIREKFINMQIMDSEHSNDILRIDLNTLRSMGCEISRSSQKTDHKYVLSKHPFALNITSEEVDILRKGYKRIKSTLDVKALYDYDRLFKKISEYISDENIKEEILGISNLSKYETKIDINDLDYDCKSKRIIKILYKSPVSKSSREIEVTAQELVLRNNKLYLLGYDK